MAAAPVVPAAAIVVAAVKAAAAIVVVAARATPAGAIGMAVAGEAVLKSTTLGAMEQVAPAGALAQANATLPVVALWPVSVSGVEPEAPAETLKPAPEIAGAGTGDGV